jgi:hypothetical protein
VTEADPIFSVEVAAETRKKDEAVADLLAPYTAIGWLLLLFVMGVFTPCLVWVWRALL